jgi:tripartite-type tricarboxylate transporter receptor subunit TctC
MRIERLAIAVLFLASATMASAQSYPSRPITIVVPTTAGGPPDASARILGERDEGHARPAYRGGKYSWRMI